MKKEKVKEQDVSKKVNRDFYFISLGVSACSEINSEGKKNYRTVYDISEIETLYIDLELVNKNCGEKVWNAEVINNIYRLEGEKRELLISKQEKIKIPDHAIVIKYECAFNAEELPQGEFFKGEYIIEVEINGIQIYSDIIHLVDLGDNKYTCFKPLQTGLDKIGETTEHDTGLNLRSFRCMDINGLNDVRFYFMAEHLPEEKLIYEFILLLLNQNGETKARHIIRNEELIQTDEGRKFLFFAVDLGNGDINFWKKGGYALKVIYLNKLLMGLDFHVAEKDIPYDYKEELNNYEQTLISNESDEITIDNKEEVLDNLYRLTGLRKIKEEVTKMSEYAEFIAMRRDNGFNDRFPTMNLLFAGNPGTGKATVGELMARLFYNLGMLSTGRFENLSISNFLNENNEGDSETIQQIIEDNRGGVLYIENPSEIFNRIDMRDKGIFVLNNICNFLAEENPDLIVILADTHEGISILSDFLPDIRSCFPKLFYFEDYSPDDLMEITKNKLKEKEYIFTPGAENKFYKLIKTASTDKAYVFTNGDFIDERIEDITQRMAERLMSKQEKEYNPEEMMLIQEEDVVIDSKDIPEQPFEKLKEVLAESELRQSFVQHLNYVFFMRERQKKGFDDIMPPLNMLFCGNPGTGKYTVAKTLAEIYFNAGILSSSEVIVHNARNFNVEKGESLEQAVALLLSNAYGGILYIENACSMLKTPVGVAIFQVILSALSPEEFNQLIVVLADIPEEIDKLMLANQGLNSYFPYRFDFKDYTAQDLLKIAVNKIKERNYALHPKAKEALGELIREVNTNSGRTHGNAVWVDKIVNIIIRKMSERIMVINRERELTRQELTTIMAADIPANEIKKIALKQDEFDEEEIGCALKDLDKMVGQAKMKKQIKDFVNLARQYHKRGIKLNSQMSLQWCFTGNSGIGKKALAKIIARLYKGMGLVENTDVTVFKVEKLIGLPDEDIQRNLKDVLIKAQGGILLYDEDSRKIPNTESFRERVRNMLMTQMIEQPGTVIVIYAGQQLTLQSLRNDVEKAADIINILYFEDYTNDELMRILKRKLADENMKLSVSAKQHMVNFIASLNSASACLHSSARMMRIVIELMIRNTMQRISKNSNINVGRTNILTVIKADVEMFNEDFIADITDDRKKIGFKRYSF